MAPRSGTKIRIKVWSRGFEAKFAFKQATAKSIYVFKVKDLDTGVPFFDIRSVCPTLTLDRLFEGHRFKVAVELRNNGRIVETAAISFRCVFSKHELGILIGKLKNLELKLNDGSKHGLFQPIKYFHRCEFEASWKISTETGIIGAKCQKTGHKGSTLLNSNLKGVWFASNVDCNGNLPLFSVFADERFLIWARKLFNPSKIRLFFADVYCFGRVEKFHAVSLVMAERGSKEERYCVKYMRELNVYKNPFLFLDKNTGKVMVARHLYVNVFYAKDIPLEWGCFDKQRVYYIGKGCIGECKICTTCEHCNL